MVHPKQQLHLQVMVNPKQQLCLQVMVKNLHLQLQAERGKAPPHDQCHCNSLKSFSCGIDVEV
jgi:hypothetical protein